MTRRSLIRSTSIIGGATVTSRLLGFLRDILFAKFFGTNIFAQAFVVAFRLPNILRDMVGEGATNAVIVPVLTGYKHTRSKKEYWEAAQVIFNFLISLLVAITMLGVLFAPLLVRIIAPGFVDDHQKFKVTVELTRMIFPYILLLGLVAYANGVLNSMNYFLTPALSPVILNICMVTAIFSLCPRIGIWGLVFGVIIGGISEVLFQVKPLISRGMRFDRKFILVHPVVKRVGKLLIPRALGSAVYQMSIFVDTILASLAWIVGAGGVAGLYYANRLVQLPLAVFGVSLATAALPKMSREVAINDIGEMKKTMAFSLNTVFTIMLPSTVGLMILSVPIVRILFERGEFTAYSTDITAHALFFYSIGLFAYGGIKILVNAYYSMGDTSTPVKTAAIALLVNVVLNLMLMCPLKIGGLALATSLAAITNFLILYVVFVRRMGDIDTKDIVLSFVKISIATGIMGICTFYLKNIFLNAIGIRAADAILRLLAVIIVSFMVYVIASWICGVKMIRKSVKHLTGGRG